MKALRVTFLTPHSVHFKDARIEAAGGAVTVVEDTSGTKRPQVFLSFPAHNLLGAEYVEVADPEPVEPLAKPARGKRGE